MLEQQQPTPKPPTIQKTPETENIDSSSNQVLLTCDVCSFKHDDIRDFSQVIVVSIPGSLKESYCDICLEYQLEKESSELKKLEEMFIYQKQFETSVSESDRRVFQIDIKDPNEDLFRKEFEQLQAEQRELDRALANYREDSRDFQVKVHALEQKEQKFWVDLNKFQKRAVKLEQKAFIAKNQRQVEKEELEELSKTSIVHKFFQIQIEDSYAQVCGLTVGKKPDQIDVNWDETNAALGHLLLAYNYLSIRYQIQYTRFSNIKIKGHLSEVKMKTSQAVYPLAYTSKENEKVFGIVLQNILGELAELAQQIQEKQNIEYSEELKIPFQILKKQGKIVDLHVNPTKIEDKNRWGQWTKAMRYLLIDLKHVLTISLLSDPYL